MQINEIMSKSVISVSPDESAAFASRLLSRNNIGAIPVCTQNGRLCGILTDRDIVTRCIAMGADALNTPVKAIMTSQVITASPNDSAEAASLIMAQKQIRRLPVVEKGNLIGIVSLGDIAKASPDAPCVINAFSEISKNVRRA